MKQSQFSEPSHESGFGLIEVLFSMVIVGIIGASVLLSLITAARTAGLTEVNYIANNVATSAVELLAAKEPANVDASDSLVETGIAIPGSKLTFRRETTVTVNADNSRTVEVVVQTENYLEPVEVNLVSRFSVWE